MSYSIESKALELCGFPHMDHGCNNCVAISQALREAMSEGERRERERWIGEAELSLEKDRQKTFVRLQDYMACAEAAESKLAAYEKKEYVRVEQGYHYCPDCVTEYRKTEGRLRAYDKSGPGDEETKDALNAIDDHTDGSRHPWRKFAHVLARALRADRAKIADLKESANAHRDAQIRAEDLVRKLSAAIKKESSLGNSPGAMARVLALVPDELRSDK